MYAVHKESKSEGSKNRVGKSANGTRRRRRRERVKGNVSPCGIKQHAVKRRGTMGVGEVILMVGVKDRSIYEFSGVTSPLLKIESAAMKIASIEIFKWISTETGVPQFEQFYHRV